MKPTWLWKGCGALVVVNASMALLWAATPHTWSERAKVLREEKLEPRFARLLPLHVPKRPPEPEDWLAQHDEPGQSVAEYRASSPVRPNKTLRAIYLQPLGELSEEQARLVAVTAEGMHRFFGVPSKVLEPLPLSVIPDSARRNHPSWGMPQLLSPYILDQVLIPKRPKDAVAYVALTPVDLYPDPSWNFVFGQASLVDRVGVWSLYRNAESHSGKPASASLQTRRTVSIALHETGHILGLHHCVAWECLMNGSNNRAESDAAPLHLCPACLAKLCWNTRCDPVRRFEQLAEWAERTGVEDPSYSREAAKRVGKGP